MNKNWTIDASKYLNDEQIQTLNSYLKAQRDLGIARGLIQPIKDYYIILGLLHSGSRVVEFATLKLSDFHGNRLSVRFGKGGKSRTIVLTLESQRIFQEWLVVRAKLGFSTEPNSPLFPSRLHDHYTTRGIQKRTEKIFEACGLPPNLTTHSLRHTNCTLLITAQVPLSTVRDNLGHSSIAVTNIYAHSCVKLDYIASLTRAPKAVRRVPGTSPRRQKSVVSLFTSKKEIL